MISVYLPLSIPQGIPGKWGSEEDQVSTKSLHSRIIDRGSDLCLIVWYRFDLHLKAREDLFHDFCLNLFSPHQPPNSEKYTLGDTDICMWCIQSRFYSECLSKIPGRSLLSQSFGKRGVCTSLSAYGRRDKLFCRIPYTEVLSQSHHFSQSLRSVIISHLWSLQSGLGSGPPVACWRWRRIWRFLS